MKKLISILAILVLISNGAVGGENKSAPDHILVKFKEGTSEAAEEAVLKAHGMSVKSEIPKIGVKLIHIPPNMTPEDAVERLKKENKILFAEPDRLVPPEFTPNDPYFIDELHTTMIRAPQAWDVTTGKTSVVIAILDTGVDITHPDLSANVVPGWNFFDNNSDTSDVYGHGTNVAGTAAAVGNNALGVVGVAFNCRFMPIRVSDLNGNGSWSAMANGLTYAADHGARVANISYKVTDSATVTTAAQYFQSKGGVTTVSAGNDGAFDSTADNPSILTVSATDSSDVLTSWSCTGNNIDLAAPGMGIWNTMRGGGYGAGVGTSFSAPIVAAVAALVISANPNLTGLQIQDVLKQSARDLGAPGWDSSYGWGRVDAYKAVLAANGQTPSDNTAPTAAITSPTNGSIVSGTISVVASATDDVGIIRLECYLNGSNVGSKATSPLTLSWNTAGRTDGSYTLQAKAYDAAGNIGISPMVTVQIQNTTTSLPHPADANSDYLMSVDEATHFSFCWKSGSPIPSGCPNPAPSDYQNDASRAATLWLSSSQGTYRYDSTQTCPLCWVVVP